jgi:hypothetical protein
LILSRPFRVFFVLVIWARIRLLCSTPASPCPPRRSSFPKARAASTTIGPVNPWHRISDPRCGLRSSPPSEPKKPKHSLAGFSTSPSLSSPRRNFSLSLFTSLPRRYCRCYSRTLCGCTTSCPIAAKRPSYLAIRNVSVRNNQVRHT